MSSCICELAEISTVHPGFRLTEERKQDKTQKHSNRLPGTVARQPAKYFGDRNNNSSEGWKYSREFSHCAQPYQGVCRHSPDSRLVGRDAPFHRGGAQGNSIAATLVCSQIGGLLGSRGCNPLLCVHRGAPL